MSIQKETGAGYVQVIDILHQDMEIYILFFRSEDPLLGICPYADMWDSFLGVDASMDMLNRSFVNIARFLGVNDGSDEVSMLELFRKIDDMTSRMSLNEIEKNIQHEIKIFHTFFREYEPKGITFLEFLN